MKKKLKMYVWDAVQLDSAPSIIFAAAYTVDEARAIIMKEDTNADVQFAVAKTPKEFSAPAGIVFYGS